MRFEGPLLGLALLGAACGPAGRDSSPDAPGSQADAADPGDGPLPPDASRVYAHSGKVLYRIDTGTLAAVPIGEMTALPPDRSLLDLAIDKQDNLVGITREALYSVSPTTGAVALIRDLTASAQGFTSLSFVPAGLAGLPDPASPDILVAANEQGNVYRIDPAAGTATLLGNYGTAAGGQIKSSGDLFGVQGVGIFATVDVGDGTMDYLARVDPANGWRATPLGIGTGYDKIFGLGYWNGKIYGFIDDGFDAGTGRMIEIDPNTGAGTLLLAGNVRWFGAGVATDAPIIE